MPAVDAATGLLNPTVVARSVAERLSGVADVGRLKPMNSFLEHSIIETNYRPL
jgi:hypothetical protein